jgi:proline dehydrogenase
LENYDDGRRKSFYCLAVNLLELDDINIVMNQIKDKVDSQTPLKEKASIVAGLFNAMADDKKIVLKLRK